MPFRDWALSHGYRDDLTIDRINTDGNYCPENCRWATYSEQNMNTKRSKRYEFNGETHTLREWSPIIGIPLNILEKRVNDHKWPIEKALTQPIAPRYLK